MRIRNLEVKIAGLYFFAIGTVLTILGLVLQNEDVMTRAFLVLMGEVIMFLGVMTFILQEAR